MSRIQMAFLFLCGLLLGCAGGLSQSPSPHTVKSFYDLSAISIQGQQISFSQYRGKVLLVVNTSTRCGTTPQYGDLQKLYETYRDRGLVVLGFPSHDFGGKYTETGEEIEHFCFNRYGVTFPMFEPGHVKGADMQEVYSFLTARCDKHIQGEVGFNFEKFLLDRSGQVRARFGSFSGPLDSAIVAEIEKLLEQPLREHQG